MAKALRSAELHKFYNPEGDIEDHALVDLNSGNVERGICALLKNRIISEGLRPPEGPDEVIARYPGFVVRIKGLREAAFGILVRDASLSARHPLINLTQLHPKDQGCLASFGAHPRFFVDSSGVISWNFFGDKPEFAFADWNFSTITAEYYTWLCECITAEGNDIYVADFSEQGAYSCRILVPGMSEV